VTKRRLGCLFFGLVWVAVFGFTNFGLALGDREPNAPDILGVAFWIEIAVFVVAALLFYRAEMKDSEF
jgi:hypothetical protein